MHWILVILLTSGYKGGVTTQEFPGEISCNNAGREITAYVKNNRSK